MVITLRQKIAEAKETYSIYLIYKDVETGTKASKRPSDNRMLVDIKMGKVNVVASVNISRLNGNLREFHELYDITQHHNVWYFLFKGKFRYFKCRW